MTEVMWLCKCSSPQNYNSGVICSSCHCKPIWLYFFEKQKMMFLLDGVFKLRRTLFYNNKIYILFYWFAFLKYIFILLHFILSRFIELHFIFLNQSLPSDCKGMFWMIWMFTTNDVDVGTWPAWVNYLDWFFILFFV